MNIAFEVNHDYFTDDTRWFFRIVSMNNNMVAGQTFEKVAGNFRKTLDWILPPADVSQALEEYNGEIDNWEEEFDNENL